MKSSYSTQELYQTLKTNSLKTLKSDVNKLFKNKEFKNAFYGSLNEKSSPKIDVAVGLLKKSADCMNANEFDKFIQSGKIDKAVKLSNSEMEALKAGANWWVRFGVATCSALVTVASGLSGAGACIIGVVKTHDAGY